MRPILLVTVAVARNGVSSVPFAAGGGAEGPTSSRQAGNTGI